MYLISRKSKLTFTATLLLAGFIGCLAKSSSADESFDSSHFRKNPNSSSPWRRTVDGWELSGAWNGQPDVALKTPAIFAVHPLVIALLQLLISLSALIAFSPTVKKEQPGKTQRIDSIRKQFHPKNKTHVQTSLNKIS